MKLNNQTMKLISTTSFVLTSLLVWAVIILTIQKASASRLTTWTAKVEDVQLTSLPQAQLNISTFISEKANSSESIRVFLARYIEESLVDGVIETATQSNAVKIVRRSDFLNQGKLEITTIKALENGDVMLSIHTAMMNIPLVFREVHKCEKRRKWYGKTFKRCYVVKESRPINNEDLKQIEDHLTRSIESSVDFLSFVGSSLTSVVAPRIG